MAQSVTMPVVVALLLAGCETSPEGDTVWLRIRGSPQQLSAAAIVYEPEGDLRSARLGAGNWLAIERRSAARALTVHVPEYCPLTIPAGPPREQLWLVPIIDLGGDRPPLGFGARFAISVAHGCAERGQGVVSWRQTAGEPLDELEIGRDGFTLSARTPALERLYPTARPDGIVPLSPRTQGRAVLEATWSGPLSPKIVRSVAISASSRASGVASVAVSQQLVLGDAGYRVRSAPVGGHARPLPSGEVALFTPDAPGRWVLERTLGAPLTLHAFWHDKTPYDCGRAECHAQIAADTLHSPMSHALERQLGGPSPAAVGCMLDCHVVGERGLRDGGFLDVAGELGVTRFDTSRWQDLPQLLRRLGGVRCTACHGPGAIPPPEGRAAILRSDVCATCHDAPPRYVHVQAWRTSRMARSDALPSTRAGACASCHTTAGFLAAAAARSGPLEASAASAGIACAACHAPHASHRGARLLRSVPQDADSSSLDPVSALCARCHAPAAETLPPSAAAAVFFRGSARIPTQSAAGWELVRGPSAHAAVPKGCVGCHGAQDTQLDHSFRVDPGVCVKCHEDRGGAAREITERARLLLRRLGAHCSLPEPSSQPLHADPAAPSCTEQRFTRALYAVSLVLEDPAAGLHNAPFARELLRDAQQQLEAAPAR